MRRLLLRGGRRRALLDLDVPKGVGGGWLARGLEEVGHLARPGISLWGVRRRPGPRLARLAANRCGLSLTCCGTAEADDAPGSCLSLSSLRAGTAASTADEMVLACCAAHKRSRILSSVCGCSRASKAKQLPSRLAQ